MDQPNTTSADSESPALFCSSCGKKASGRFCWSCGSPLHAGADGAGSTTVAAVEWSTEVDYRTLIEVAEVREQIAKQAALAEKGMSAEEFLGSAEKVLGPLAAGVSLLPVAELGHKLGSGLGIGTSKSRVEQFDLPVGRVIVGALCSLARRGMAIDTVEQGEDGCLIEAAMPSSAFILAGTLAIVVSREGSGARVEAAAKVTGQMFDWGASRKSLSNLFTDIGRFAPAEIVG